MNTKPKLYNADQASETREEIHAETRDWFPSADSLAQQLGSDARRLAQRYPAPNTEALLALMLREQAAAATPETVTLPRTAETIHPLDEPANEFAAPRAAARVTAWPFPQTAAAALLLVAGWSLLRWSADRPLTPPREVTQQLAEQPRPAEMIPVAIPHAPLAPQEFQTLSAPEREAVLDLLEEQALGTVSLSI